MLTNEQIEDIVYEKITKFEEGYTRDEIINLIESFDNVEEEEFWDKLGVNTCMLIAGETVTFASDIYTALICCIENRDKTAEEWD